VYRLIYQDGETTRHYDFDAGDVVIGRSPECQVCARDFGISRQHARVVVDGDGPRLIDLGSKNGSQVNGVSVLQAPLRTGDKIRLASFELTFLIPLDGRVVLEDAQPLEDSGTIVRSVGDLSNLLAGAEPRKDSSGREPPDAREIRTANRILRVLTSVAETLIAVRPVEDVLQRVMDIVFDNLPADRGFLMLTRDGSDELVPTVIRSREKEGGEITISKQIARKVIRERVSILAADARIDERFSGADSIAIHGIRSVICAPLWNGADVIGIVFVDSLLLTNRFTEDDLDLLTALASYAGVAVERARLNQRILAEERKRERLGRFLSPEVTKRILATSAAEDDALGQPEVRDVTILFSDLCGFTSMSESMNPAAVAVLLNQYLGAMTEAIFEQEGTLDKYIGDAIMAVFGAPLDMPDHAACAIRAALAMRARLEDFNAQRTTEPELRMRIGLNSGRVLACEIGGRSKREYTVLGDAVNIASRLESSVAMPMMIVIGETTHAEVTGQFAMRPLGNVALKGRQRTIDAWEVIGELGTDSPDPRATAEPVA